tara:strand:+ start:247 stop:468 length:222 start_codon:yes stop_codon:yes gene_type:complete
MKIFVTLNNLGAILDVYYAVLKDGTVAVKCSLDSDFVMFMTKSQFKQLIEMAREKEADVSAANFVLQRNEFSH